ncbi:MAG TPA: hypothetical protein VFF81_12265 [Noviherbaspirillum sp.]|nr:hypothetical protein [Noviherbaspirillum sp.]
MIWAIDESEPKWPVGRIYRLATDSVEGDPEVLTAHSSADFILVSGRIDVVDHVTKAIGIVEQNKKEYQLAVAVMAAAPGQIDDASARGTLHSAFDAVFIVEPDAADEVVRRLARALITPGSAFQPGCCDWNDMRYIVAGQKGSPPRFGFGRATGQDFPARAAQAAIENVRGNYPVSDNACAAVIVTLPKDARGAWYKEAIGVTRNYMGANSSFALGLVIDEALPADTAEVDVFVFGDRHADLLKKGSMP